MISRYLSPETRSLLAFTLALDPSLRPTLRRFLKLAKSRIRHDYMLIRQPTGDYHQLPDPCTLYADITPNVGVMLLRSHDGQWWLNGF